MRNWREARGGSDVIRINVGTAVALVTPTFQSAVVNFALMREHGMQQEMSGIRCMNVQEIYYPCVGNLQISGDLQKCFRDFVL